MPMYEYRCPKCGAEFEKLLRVSERDEPQPCSNKECDVKEVNKMISRTSFSLKGGGWASDGYSG
jgi:putative FmdB family regulatory protein